MLERAHQAAGATVRDHEPAPRQHVGLVDVPLHSDVRGLLAEVVRVDVAADGDEHLGRHAGQPGQQALEQVARAGVEDRAEA